MGGECIKYTLRKTKHYYFLYMKSIHKRHQPTTFIGKGPNLEKLLQYSEVHAESREELRKSAIKLKPGQEASIQYENYSWG